MTSVTARCYASGRSGVSNLKFLVGAAALIVVSLAFAVGPIPNFEEHSTFRALISELGGRDEASRARAERKLAEVGFPAIPYLRKAVGHSDPEVRRRVMRLLPALEHAALV